MKSRFFKTLVTGAFASALALGAGTGSALAQYDGNQAGQVQQDQSVPPERRSQTQQSQDPRWDNDRQPYDAQADQDRDQDNQDQNNNGPREQASNDPRDEQNQDVHDDGPRQPQSRYAHMSAEQLQQLVAPIALYPDSLVAQILAASAYPTQIVQAQRFLQENPDLKGHELGEEVDKQDWDPSVKALVQYPTVLSHLDKNLSWTSALGDANYNQQADVMGAIQVMRKKAEDAGTLKTTPQQRVSNSDRSVIIQPNDDDEVYVPDYDPRLVYGYPVGLWPGFYPWWGFGGPYLSFGVGFGIRPFWGFGWGWGGWGCDWYGRGLIFGGGRYFYHSPGFYARAAYFHGNYRGYAPYYRGAAGRGYAGRGYAGRGYSPSRGYSGRSYSGSRYGGASGGYSHSGGSYGGGYHGGGGASSHASGGSSGHSSGGGGRR